MLTPTQALAPLAPVAQPSTGPCACSAVVLWLPPGEKPSHIAHFNVAEQLRPSECSSETWWSLEQALGHVQASKNDHGKQPWIKVGDIVLSPTDILDLHNFYKHHGTRK